MKRLIILMLVAIPLLVVQAQQTDILSLGVKVGDGISYADSLYYGTPGDSSMIIKWDYRFSIPQIYLKGNSNSPIDSLEIRTGLVRFNSRGTAIDTIWGRKATLKDSSFTTVYTAINNTVGVDYVIYENSIQLVKIKLLNNRANLVARKVQIGIGARTDIIKQRN
jgi:hypothetical protein